VLPSAPGHHNLSFLVTVGQRMILDYQTELNIGAKGGVQPMACTVFTAPALSATFSDFELSVAGLLRSARNDRAREQPRTIRSMSRQSTKTALHGLDCAC